MSTRDIGHGKVKRYKTNQVYIPEDVWSKISTDNQSDYVADMQTALFFKPGIDAEVLMRSIDLLKLYLKKEIAKTIPLP